MSRRSNPPGSTTAAGLGYEHQQQRKAALQALRSGIDVCPRCRRPLYIWQRLDLDDFPSRVIARRFGVQPLKLLSHRSCNRSAGATLGNALNRGKTRKRARRTVRRSWLDQQHDHTVRVALPTLRRQPAQTLPLPDPRYCSTTRPHTARTQHAHSTHTQQHIPLHIANT